MKTFRNPLPVSPEIAAAVEGWWGEYERLLGREGKDDPETRRFLDYLIGKEIPWCDAILEMREKELRAR